MFLTSLIISTPTTIIRELHFSQGLNLIIDETPTTDTTSTGNNVGKTTVLKLVDFCLGANSNIIYEDTEDKKSVYQEVKDFLISNEVLITLILAKEFATHTDEIIIERNFLHNKQSINRINGKDILQKDFEKQLQNLLIPGHLAKKPTFRQITSHNIRYKDESINNTVKTINKYTSDVEYEALYLFLFGCIFYDGADKKEIFSKLHQEKSYKERLEKTQTKTSYELALSLIDDEIGDLVSKKSSFNLNEEFENDLDALNAVKYKINRCSSALTNMNIRKDLITEAMEQLEKDISRINVNTLKALYLTATREMSGIQKTFEEMLAYHNTMVCEKSRFIGAELPDLEKRITSHKSELKELLSNEKFLSQKIAKDDSFSELEFIIDTLNEKHKVKGEYESIVSQIEEVEQNITTYTTALQEINTALFSQEFEETLKSQLKKFNKHFASISNELYGEKYALTYKVYKNKKGEQVYTFSSFNLNTSSGKKMGEILCFDLAYTAFADEEDIPCLHFLLNDKKELMHDNQLNKVADYVKDKHIQLIVSILKDKLPPHLINSSHVVVELSQTSKLFKIEELVENSSKYLK